MDVSCLQYALTAEERQHFEEHGYLIVPNVLSQENIERCLVAVDRLDAEKRAEGLGPFDFTPPCLAHGTAFRLTRCGFAGRS